MHIVDDYYLQGILASMKQKSWWQKNAPDKKYRFDYLVALFMHSFSWTFMIMLPITISLHFNIGWWVIAYIVNMIIHTFVDNLKANKFKINLVIDQSIHIVQIVVTWLVFVLV
jgi:hypothetical protein